jgi:uncharacterized membrane protein YfcA
MSPRGRILSHPAVACLAALLGLVLAGLPLGAEPWLRQPVSLYPWLFAVWLVLLAFLLALGRSLADRDRRETKVPGPTSMDERDERV